MKKFLGILLTSFSILFADIDQDATINTVLSSDSNMVQTEHEEEDIMALRPAVPLNHSLWFYIMWTLIGILPFACLLYLIKLFRKQKTPTLINISPYAQALQDLEHALQLIQKTNQKPFAFALTDAVRFYLANVFQLPAPECTTEEVLEQLPTCSVITPDLRQEITQLLQQCDLAKFTQQTFDQDFRLKLYQQAKGIIQAADKCLQIKTESTNTEAHDTNIRI